jgi:serine protease Do
MRGGARPSNTIANALFNSLVIGRRNTEAGGDFNQTGRLKAELRRGAGFGRTVRCIGAVFISVCVAASPARGAAAVDPRRDAAVESVQMVMPAVVNIATETVVQMSDPMENLFREFFDPYYRRRPPNAQHSLGSGVIIDEEGFVLTNYHVVGRASRIMVKLMDGREFEADRVNFSSLSDVALLKIRTTNQVKFTAVKFAADDDLLLGETVLALGNPFGLGGSVSKGILSSKSRRPAAENEPLDVLDWLQTDAAINPGNSGGPLINLRGELIGINVAIYREGQGIGFAIPVKRLSAALSEIYSPEGLESLWFGARVRPGAAPLQVMSVQIESPAGKAGLRAGDRILQVNGKAPRGFMDFIAELRAVKDKRDVVLAVDRGGESKRLEVRMVPEKTFFNADMIRRRTGASVQELTPELAQSFGFARVDGLLVAGVDRESPAEAAELQRGMVISRMEGESTTSVLATAKRLYARPKGEKIQVEIIYPRRRGPFLELVQRTVELKLQ